MDMASFYTNGTTYAKAVLRNKSENSNDLRSNHRGSYNSINGISRSVGTSSVGDSDGHDDTTDWPELEYKKKFIAAPPPKENPWHVNPNAAAFIAMKFPPATVNDGDKPVTGNNSTQTSAKSSEGSNKSSAFQSGTSSEKLGSSRTSGPVNKGRYPGSPMKSSQSKNSGGDSSSLPPRNGYGGGGRGRGRGGLGSSGGRGRGSYRGGGKNYYHHNNYYTDPNESNAIPSPVREDYKDFSPEYTTLTPIYAPPSDYIMPYLATFPPAFAPPLETTGILTLTEEQSFPSFVTVDTLRVEMVKNQIEYYFSEENLEKDFFLRRKMDAGGYLPVQLIASFHRVKSMTEDYSIVVTAIQSSDKLELSEDMGFVRTVNNPTKWPIMDSVVSLSISLTAMKISPMLPSPASSIVDTELDGMISASSPIDSAIPSPSNGITVQSTMVTANGNSETFNPNVPEFVPKSKVLY